VNSQPKDGSGLAHGIRAHDLTSISGSLLLLAYFTSGKNDSVGIHSNLFPAGVAGFNPCLDLRHKRSRAHGDQLEFNH
jgi:lipid-A-disaccharide synthase-like uncharacterized protein